MLLNTVNTAIHLFVGLFMERCPVFVSFVKGRGIKLANKVTKTSDKPSKHMRPDFFSPTCDSWGINYISGLSVERRSELTSPSNF